MPRKTDFSVTPAIAAAACSALLAEGRIRRIPSVKMAPMPAFIGHTRLRDFAPVEATDIRVH